MQRHSDYVRNAFWSCIYIYGMLSFLSLLSVTAANIFFGLEKGCNNQAIITFQKLIPKAFVSLSNKDLTINPQFKSFYRSKYFVSIS